jgi:hypothetical protein
MALFCPEYHRKYRGNIATAMSDVVVHPNPNRLPLARPQDTLLCDMDLPLSATLYPLGFAVTILTNRHEVLSAAEATFGHRSLQHGDAHLEIRIGVSESKSRRTPPLPIRREYNHLYSIVADAENQALLDLRTLSNFVWLNESALADPLYLRQNFLEKVVYLLLGASVVTDIHAGCVSKHGKGILLCGDSGAGKSTLSYGCARAGWTYTSDDTCYLLNNSNPPRVIGHSHRVRFRPEAKTLFSELREFEITQRMEGKPSIEVSVSDLPLFNTSNEATVCAVVYLRRSPSARTALISLPHGTSAQRISEELFSAGEIRAKHQKMLRRLAGIATFELHYQSLEVAISQLDRLLESL